MSTSTRPSFLGLRNQPKRLVLAGVAFAMVAAMTAASAATLGGIGSGNLHSDQQPADPRDSLPNPLLTETFTGPNAALTGHVADTGQIWTITNGNWRIQGNVGSVNSNNASSRISMNLSRPGVTMTGILRFTSATTRSCGYMLNGDSGSSLAVVIRYLPASGGSIQVAKWSGGALATLQTFTGVGTPANNVNVPLTVVTNPTAGSYTTTFNGNLIGTTTLSPGDKSAISNQTWVGLFCSNDTKTQFDNLSVTWP